MPEGSAKSRPDGTWKCFSHMCNFLPNRKKSIHGFMVDTIIVFSWRNEFEKYLCDILNEFGRYLCDILNEFGMFSQYSRDNPLFANVDINVNQFQQTDFVSYSCYNKLYIIIQGFVIVQVNYGICQDKWGHDPFL